MPSLKRKEKTDDLEENSPRSLASHIPTRRVTRGLIITGLVFCLYLLLQHSGLGQPRFEFNYVSIPIHPEKFPWKGYKDQAWAQDELRPIAGGYKTPFCGWAATMVDSLDTLWIMDLKGEFELALGELRNVDFTHKQGCNINLFETTIRHLGGFLSAYDLSGGKYTILIEKAVELAEVLYTAFDTPNRMPTPHYMWSA